MSRKQSPLKQSKILLKNNDKNIINVEQLKPSVAPAIFDLTISVLVFESINKPENLIVFNNIVLNKQLIDLYLLCLFNKNSRLIAVHKNERDIIAKIGTKEPIVHITVLNLKDKHINSVFDFLGKKMPIGPLVTIQEFRRLFITRGGKVNLINTFNKVMEGLKEAEITLRAKCGDGFMIITNKGLDFTDLLDKAPKLSD